MQACPARTPLTPDQAGRLTPRCRFATGGYGRGTSVYLVACTARAGAMAGTNHQPSVFHDIRAYKSLRGSPLAMDIYTWLTYRFSYMQRPTSPIPWEVLMMQLGSGYGGGDITNPQAIRDFRKGFKTALSAVSIIYPKANIKLSEAGIILLPSPPHVQKSRQIQLL